MGKYGKFLVGILILLLVASVSEGKKKPKSNLPISKEATLVESSNPAEVMVLATGIGEGKKKELTRKALLDARRAAVYFVLLGGTDPLLQTQEERRKFAAVQEKYFAEDRISKYIAWEATSFERRIKIAGGKKLKVQKYFKVNKELLKNDLIADGVLTVIAGPLPFIMVIPEVPKGENPVERMNAEPRLKHAARVIESYLTARKYDVLVPEQVEAIQALSEAQESLKGFEEDYSYQLALSIGSDVYITYAIDVQARGVGSSTVRKAMVSVRAYETTTARLLGTETGYSVERPSPELVVVEEAINDAVDKVLSRINAYWKEDLKRGVQYKLIVRIGEDFDEDEVEDISFAISDLIDRFCNYSKENVVTESTLDYLVWAKMDKFEKSSKLYRAMRKAFPQEFEDGKLRRININRKLILLKVVRAE